MNVVVKIGGAALDHHDLVNEFVRVVNSLVSHGAHVAVVHGGGAALNRTLAVLGHESRFVDGLRVTDAATRDAALMVLAGSVNKRLVAALGSAGVDAVGLCGGDLGLMRATRKRDDLGYVGEVHSVSARWIEALWTQGALPVIASVALGMDGEYYNVNADEAASACATALRADAMVFLTDVDGVRGSDGGVIASLGTNDIPAMIAAATVSGGMLPKLSACTRALDGGVGRVHILPAARAGVLPGLLHGEITCGTEVLVR